MKITKKTYDRNVKKFAGLNNDAWTKMNELFNKLGLNASAQEMICDCVDRFSAINQSIQSWCDKNGVDVSDFACDVMNETWIENDEKSH